MDAAVHENGPKIFRRCACGTKGLGLQVEKSRCQRVLEPCGDQLQMLLPPALSSRASLPSTIPIKVEQTNLLEFRSQVAT
nr:hypothetical transcript [Hymenolepis microstoma]